MSSKRTTFFLPWFHPRLYSSLTLLTPVPFSTLSVDLIILRIGMNSAIFDDTDEEFWRCCSARESDVYPIVPFSVVAPWRAPFYPAIKGVIVRGSWDPPFPMDPLPPLLLESSYKRLYCKYFLSILERNGLFKSLRFWAIILEGESSLAAAGGPAGELILGNDWMLCCYCEEGGFLGVGEMYYGFGLLKTLFSVLIGGWGAAVELVYTLHYKSFSSL